MFTKSLQLIGLYVGLNDTASIAPAFNDSVEYIFFLLDSGSYRLLLNSK